MREGQQMSIMKLSIETADLLSRFVERALNLIVIITQQKEKEIQKLIAEVELESDKEISALRKEWLKAQLSQQIAEATARKQSADFRIAKFKPIDPVPEAKIQRKETDLRQDSFATESQGSITSESSPASGSRAQQVPTSTGATLRGPIKGLEKLKFDKK